MEFLALDAGGPVVLVPQRHGDARGYFMETFRQNEFEKHCGNYEFVQDNQSRSSGPVLRGLHYQLEHPQGKLVRVIEGTVFDVVVDLRQSSAHFGKVYSLIIDSEAWHMLWVPPGFAHGFRVLGETATFLYKCTDYYRPEDEHTLLWNDPELGIDWPAGQPLLSDKDRRGKTFAECPKFA